MASSMADVGSDLAPPFAPFFGMVSHLPEREIARTDFIGRLVSLSQYVRSIRLRKGFLSNVPCEDDIRLYVKP